MAKPLILETCPVCKINFKIKSVVRQGSGSPEKVCPNGHWATVHTLRKFRSVGRVADFLAEIPPVPAVPKEPVKPRDYREAAAAMVDCFDRLMAATPARAHGVILGSFGRTVELVRGML